MGRTSDLIRICSTRIVCIYLFRCRTLIETDKPLEEILASRVIVGAACVVGEVVA
jgi:hypothetical protein